jgi:hypothetical protein
LKRKKIQGFHGTKVSSRGLLDCDALTLLAPSLKMQAASSSEMLVSYRITTRHRNPEDLDLIASS